MKQMLSNTDVEEETVNDDTAINCGIMQEIHQIDQFSYVDIAIAW